MDQGTVVVKPLDRPRLTLRPSRVALPGASAVGLIVGLIVSVFQGRHPDPGGKTLVFIPKVLAPPPPSW